MGAQKGLEATLTQPRGRDEEEGVERWEGF